MIELLYIYAWTIVAGCLTAPALSLLGSQLATTDRAMQTVCVGQGAMVGVLVGIGILHIWEGTWIGTVGPFLSALVVSGITFLVTDRLVAKQMASKNTTFAFIFALLLAAGSLVSALFPALESHMAQVYFGDLATITVRDSQLLSALALVSLSLLVGFLKSLTNQSFESAVFGDAILFGRVTSSQRATKILTLVVLCFSVQFVGFLFTIAMLFLPTALLNFLRTKGLRMHLWLCALLSLVGTVVGFLFSLKYTRLPTVPAIVVVMFFGGILLLMGERLVSGSLFASNRENGRSTPPISP